ncbi:MAG: hypothetical protein V4662_22830 [Verrucomicrobiota bacterium]
MIRPFLTSATLVLALALCSCGKKQPETPASKPAPETKPVAAVPAAPPAAKAEAPPAAAPTNLVDMSDFASPEPLERPDLPTRGIITFGPESHQHSDGAHWETYVWPNFKAKRWGKYQVRLTYTLRRSTLGLQFRMGDLVVKKTLQSSVAPNKLYLGEVYIKEAGDFPFSMLTPPTDDGSFKLIELALIPTTEGEEVKQASDGSITLMAKDATTWSENMRFEPKPEKNCLGYWTEADDFAEWEFNVAKPGKYKVIVSYGCGGGNQGSEVELKQGAQSLKWTTQDTGGFQKWQEVPVGEIEITSTGTQRLVIDPVTKVKSAALDVQKVVLTPAG